MKAQSALLPLALMAGAAGYGIYDRIATDPSRPASTPAPVSPIAAGESVFLVQMELDGLLILPAVPAVDPRPICDRLDNQRSLRLLLIWSNGQWVSCELTSPLFRAISLQLGEFGQPFSIEFAPPDLFADLDRNGRVDQADFGLAQRCLTASPDRPSADCWPADLDRDADVDQSDLAAVIDMLGRSQ